jgi:hypothetical protein
MATIGYAYIMIIVLTIVPFVLMYVTKVLDSIAWSNQKVMVDSYTRDTLDVRGVKLGDIRCIRCHKGFQFNDYWRPTSEDQFKLIKDNNYCCDDCYNSYHERMKINRQQYGFIFGEEIDIPIETISDHVKELAESLLGDKDRFGISFMFVGVSERNPDQIHKTTLQGVEDVCVIRRLDRNYYMKPTTSFINIKDKLLDETYEFSNQETLMFDKKDIKLHKSPERLGELTQTDVDYIVRDIIPQVKRKFYPTKYLV